MIPRTVRKYLYYVCGRYQRNGADACEHGKNQPAEVLEQQVRTFALDLARNPEELRAQIEAEVERQKQALRKPDREIQAWSE